MNLSNEMTAAEIRAQIAPKGKRHEACEVCCPDERTAQMVVRAYRHGAYCISREAIRTLTGDVFAARDALCDFGEDGLSVIGPEAGRAQGECFARCEAYARTLGNLPNNFLHVRQMADYLRNMAADCGLSCRVLGQEELRALGAGGILAVNQGSGEEANLVILEYRPEGAEQEKSIALVGKGVMFDAGGYHLKDIHGMEGMKMDMCGAANVAEVLEYAARVGGKVPLIGVIPLVENVVSDRAVKMGDVITTMSGQTVEVYNTDAEGRLILCDALTYAQRMGAETVVDLATLTYGCQSALGDEIGGYFCNDEALAAKFEALCSEAGEAFWRLPLADVYRKALRWSDCADLANYAPGAGAAASTAACFLEAFIQPGTRWLHLDVVGPAVRRGDSDGECKGARGVGMAVLAALAGC